MNKLLLMTTLGLAAMINTAMADNTQTPDTPTTADPSEIYSSIVAQNTADILSSITLAIAPQSVANNSMSKAMDWADGNINPEILPFLSLDDLEIEATDVTKPNERHPGSITISFNPVVYKIPGTYTLTLPAGFITWEEEGITYTTPDVTKDVEIGGVKEVTLEQFFSDPYPSYGLKGFSVEPADKETIESLSSVALNRGGNGGNIIMVDPGLPSILTLPDGTRLETTDYTIDTYCFNIFFTEQTAPGTYTLDIPAGIFGTKILGEMGSINASALNPAMTFTYRIGGDEPEPTGPEMYSYILSRNTTDILSSVAVIFAPKSIVGESMSTAMKWADGILDPDAIPYLTLGDESFTASGVAANEQNPGAIVISFDPPVYKTAGAYTLTLPEGLLSWEEEGETLCNGDYTVEVEIGGVKELTFEEFFSDPYPSYGMKGFSVEPADKETVEAISAIALNKGANGGNIIMVNPETPSILTLPNGDIVETTDYSVDTYCFNILFPEQTAAGTYTLDIPAGIFGTKILGEMGSINASALNPAMTFTYRIEGDEPKPEGPEMYTYLLARNTTDILASATVIFAPKSIVGESMSTAMKWADGTLDPNALPYLTLGDESFAASAVTANEQNPGAIVISFDPPVYKTAGTYTLTLPDGLIFWEEDGVTLFNGNHTVEVEIGGVKELSFEEFFSDPYPSYGMKGFSVEPADKETVEAISAITLSKGSNGGAIVMVDPGLPAILTLPDGTALETTDFSIDNYGFNILFPEQIANGEYTLDIPAGIFGTKILGENGSINASALNPAMVFTYTVSNTVSVDGLSDSNGMTVDVYDLTGRCIMRSVNAESIKSFEKGTYIVGNRKIVIK